MEQHSSTRIPGQRHAGILIHEDQILLIHRFNDGEYWVIPGGGCEPGEVGAQTVLREIFEETGLQPLNAKLLYQIDVNDGKGQPQTDFIYQCTDFEYKNPELVGEEKDRNSPQNSYEPQWISLQKISELNILPPHLKDYLLNNF